MKNQVNGNGKINNTQRNVLSKLAVELLDKKIQQARDESGELVAQIREGMLSSSCFFTFFMLLDFPSYLFCHDLSVLLPNPQTRDSLSGCIQKDRSSGKDREHKGGWSAESPGRSRHATFRLPQRPLVSGHIPCPYGIRLLSGHQGGVSVWISTLFAWLCTE